MAMGETELKALVAREISLAESDRKSLSERQTKALEYYQGTVKDLPAEEGRSRVVSRDLADTMGWMHPGLMRVFTASALTALCEPVGDEDEAFAKEATVGINYAFWKENDGYRVIYDATWDAMLGANGVVKVWWDETPTDTISYYSGLDDEALAELEADDEVEILAQSDEFVQVEDPATGQMIPIAVHEVKIRRQDKGGKVCVEAIPPEDYGIDGYAKTCKDARFQYHRSDKTRSDLIEMGFDRTVVESLGRAADNRTQEEIARDPRGAVDDGDPSTEVVDYYECFIRVDVDGDGIAEMCRVHYAGNSGGGEVLDWEVWEDEGPFYDIPYKPMPHRWVARSAFDETEDVQQVKTVMLRQANDNTYATNNPQRFVTGKIKNPEELFSPSFGGAVFGDTGSTVTALTVPFVANHAYDALNYQDEVVQRRTGVSRRSMALDPGQLQHQTAEANRNDKDASYSQVELVARNMAEFGFANVFKGILKLMVKHQDVAKTVRLNNKPVKIDPRWWNTGMDVTINVGLGTGSRDRDMMMLQQVLVNQLALADRFMAQGAVDQAIDMLPKVITTMTKIAESAGLRNPDAFYPDNAEEIVAKLKTAAAEKAKQPPLEVQIETAKIEATKATEAAKAEANVVKEKAQMEADLVTKQQADAFEREKLNREYAFKDRQLAQQRDLELIKLGVQTTTVEGVDGQPGATQTTYDATPAVLGRLIDVVGAMQASINAPKRVVRDEQGRAVGVEPVQMN